MGHSKIEHSKIDYSKMDHGKMDHDAIPMGMAGHDHHKMMIADFKKRFWLSTILTIPILVLSPMIQHLLGYQMAVPGNKFILLTLSTFISPQKPFKKGQPPQK